MTDWPFGDAAHYATFLDQVQKRTTDAGWPHEQLFVDLEPARRPLTRYHPLTRYILRVATFSRSHRKAVAGDTPEELLAELEKALA